MKKIETIHIIKTIEKLAVNDLDLAYVSNLFIILREKKGTTKIVTEIGHFIAHNPRDKGGVHNLAKWFFNQFSSLKNGMGGAIVTKDLLITQDELLRQIKASLLHLHFDKKIVSKLNNSAYILMKSVIDILSESIITINNGHLDKCELRSNIQDNGVVLLNVIYFPKQDSDKTVLGGPSGINFGPGLSIETILLKAIPDGIPHEGVSHVVKFNINKSGDY